MDAFLRTQGNLKGFTLSRASSQSVPGGSSYKLTFTHPFGASWVSEMQMSPQGNITVVDSVPTGMDLLPTPVQNFTTNPDVMAIDSMLREKFPILVGTVASNVTSRRVQGGQILDMTLQARTQDRGHSQWRETLKE